MTEELKARILASQAQTQIRLLSGHSRRAEDILAAAELLAEDIRYAGIDLRAIADEIVATKAFWEEEARRQLAA